MSGYVWMYGVIVVANAVLPAAWRIKRALLFGKGRILGVSTELMRFYQAGVRSGAFVQSYYWDAPSLKRAAARKRWMVLFPGTVLRDLLSVRLWLRCIPQFVLLGLCQVLWPVSLGLP